ncbi:family 1 glycosylhydrolase [Peribacillus frigoritolerans]|nr:family 1 glycosylhydrolase [Peribacillus frigoritolerans]
MDPTYPFTCAPENILAYENAEDLNNHWWLDVYCWGTYPMISMEYLERNGLAPTIMDGDMELLAFGRPDFIGVNYYRSGTVEMNPLDGIEFGDHEYDRKERNIRGKRCSRAIQIEAKSSLGCNELGLGKSTLTGLRIGLRRLTSRYRLPDPHHRKWFR